ncbi:MAG: hypothetical protein JWO62_327 [Acidimicrobiaceae bacterium]|jgi:hypothetical protein|nr:hypothetical protein [Acidimicrobiaceae bacterium]
MKPLARNRKPQLRVVRSTHGPLAPAKAPRGASDSTEAPEGRDNITTISPASLMATASPASADRLDLMGGPDATGRLDLMGGPDAEGRLNLMGRPEHR